MRFLRLIAFISGFVVTAGASAAECPSISLPNTISQFQSNFGSICSIGDTSYEVKSIEYLGSLPALGGGVCSEGTANLALTTNRNGKANQFRLCQLENKLNELEAALISRGMTLYSDAEGLVKVSVPDPHIWIASSVEELQSSVLVSLLKAENYTFLVESYLKNQLVLAQTTISVISSQAENSVIEMKIADQDAIRLSLSELSTIVNQTELQLNRIGKSVNVLRNESEQFALELSHSLSMLNQGFKEYLTELVKVNFRSFIVDQTAWRGLLKAGLQFENQIISLQGEVEGAEQIVISYIDQSKSDVIVQFSQYMLFIQSLEQDLNLIGYTLKNELEDYLALTNLGINQLLLDQTAFANTAISQINGKIKLIASEGKTTVDLLEAYLKRGVDLANYRIEMINGNIRVLEGNINQQIEVFNGAIAAVAQKIEVLESAVNQFGYTIQPTLPNYTLLNNFNLPELLIDTEALKRNLLAQIQKEINGLSIDDLKGLIAQYPTFEQYKLELLNQTDVVLSQRLSDGQYSTVYSFRLNELHSLLVNMEAQLNLIGKTIITTGQSELQAVKHHFIEVVLENEAILKETILSLLANTAQDVEIFVESFRIITPVFNNKCIQSFGDNPANYSIKISEINITTGLCGADIIAHINLSNLTNTMSALEQTLNSVGFTLRENLANQYSYLSQTAQANFLVAENKLNEFKQEVLALAFRQVELTETKVRALLSEGILIGDTRVYLEGDTVKTDPVDAFAGLPMDFSQYFDALLYAESYVNNMGYTLRNNINDELKQFEYLAEIELSSLFDDPDALIAELTDLLKDEITGLNAEIGVCSFNLNLLGDVTSSNLESLFQDNCNLNGYNFNLNEYIDGIDAKLPSCTTATFTDVSKVLRISNQGKIVYEVSTCRLSEKLTQLKGLLDKRGIDELISSIENPYDWLVKTNDELLASILLSLLNTANLTELESRVIAFLNTPIRIGSATISYYQNQAAANVLKIKTGANEAYEYLLSDAAKAVVAIEDRLNQLGQTLVILETGAQGEVAKLQLKANDAKVAIEEGLDRYLTSLVLDTIDGIQVDEQYWIGLLESKLDFGDVAVTLTAEINQTRSLIIESADDIRQISFEAYLDALQVFEGNLNAIGYSIRQNVDASLTPIRNLDVKALLVDQQKFFNDILVDINGKFTINASTIKAYLAQGVVFGNTKLDVPNLGNLIRISELSFDSEQASSAMTVSSMAFSAQATSSAGQWIEKTTLDLSVFSNGLSSFESVINGFGYTFDPKLHQFKLLPDISFVKLVKDLEGTIQEVTSKYSKNLSAISEEGILQILGDGLNVNGYQISITIPEYNSTLNAYIRKIQIMNDLGEAAIYEVDDLVSQLNKMEVALNKLGKTILSDADQYEKVRENLAQVIAEKDVILREIFVELVTALNSAADFDNLARIFSEKTYLLSNTCIQINGDTQSSYKLRVYEVVQNSGDCGEYYTTSISLASMYAYMSEVESTLNTFGLTMVKSIENQSLHYLDSILNLEFIVDAKNIDRFIAQVMAELFRFVDFTDPSNLEVLLSKGVLVGDVRVYLQLVDGVKLLKTVPEDAFSALTVNVSEFTAILDNAESYLNAAGHTLQKAKESTYNYVADITLLDIFSNPQALIEKVASIVGANINIENPEEAFAAVKAIAEQYGYKLNEANGKYSFYTPNQVVGRDQPEFMVDVSEFNDNLSAVESQLNTAGYTIFSQSQDVYEAISNVKFEYLFDPNKAEEFVKELIKEEATKTVSEYSPVTIVPSAMPSIKTVPLTLDEVAAMFDSSSQLTVNNPHCPLLNNYAGSYYLGGGTSIYFAYLIKVGTGSNFDLIPIEGGEKPCQQISMSPMNVHDLLASFNEMEIELNRYGFTLYADKNDPNLTYVEDLDVWQLFLDPESVIESLLRDLGTAVEKIAQDKVEEVKQDAINAVLGEECSNKPNIALPNISGLENSTKLSLAGKATTVGAVKGFVENSVMAMCALGVNFEELDTDVESALGAASLAVTTAENQLNVAITRSMTTVAELELWAKDVEDSLKDYAADSIGLDPDDLGMIMLLTDQEALEDKAKEYLDDAVNEYLGEAAAKLAQLEAYYNELEATIDELIPDIPDLPSPVAPKYPELKMQKKKEWTGLEYGNKNYLGTEAKASYELRGSKTAQAATAEFDTLVHVFGDALSLAGGYMSGKVATDSVFYTHKLRVLGYDVGDKTVENGVGYQFEDNVDAMSVKAEVSATFMVGPVPVNLTAGAKGSAGYTIEFGLTPLKIYGGLGPMVSASGYASASAGIRGLLSVGAEAQLLIMRADMPLRGEVGLSFPDGEPMINMDLVGELRVTTLDGRIFAYVEYLEPRAGIPPWKRKKAKKDLVKWKGQKYSTTFMSWGLTLGHTKVKTRGKVLDQNDISEFAVFEDVTSRFDRYNKLLAYQSDTNQKTKDLFNELKNIMQSPIEKSLLAATSSVESLDADIKDVYKEMLNSLAEGGFIQGSINGVYYDFDSDNDGITDSIEVSLGMNAGSTDSDGDGLPDAYEFEHNLNPTNKIDGNVDSDGDGISDRLELEWGTDPQVKDDKYIASWLIPVLSILH